MAVSWGGHESLIIPRIASMEVNAFAEKNEMHRLIRIYVGLEDSNYLIEDLKQALVQL